MRPDPEGRPRWPKRGTAPLSLLSRDQTRAVHLYVQTESNSWQENITLTFFKTRLCVNIRVFVFLLG